MGHVRIRKMMERDAGRIAEILRELGWFDYMKKETFEKTLERVKAHIGVCCSDGSHSLYVAETESSRVAGYAAVHWLSYLFLPGPEGYVSELFVDVQYRGGGIGQTLLDAIQEEATKRGCSRLMLINSRNRESYLRGFYRKQGWEERDKMANFVRQLQSEYEGG